MTGNAPEMTHPPAGNLVIVSGPSGAGKSTVVRELISRCNLPLELSVSATTRRPRSGEQDGREYFFLAPEEFTRRRKAGEFLECKEVFGQGDWYGTLRATVTAGLGTGKWVVLEIDVEGAMIVLDQLPAITVFLHPGSSEELEHRLRMRGTETEESIQRRLEVARHEMTLLPRYRYEVVNETVAQAVKELCDILRDHQ